VKVEKAEARDRKYARARYGMRVSGKSVFTIVAIQVKRASRKEL